MIDIKILAQRLNAGALALARELLPAGVKEGNEYRCGSLRGDPGRSLAVHLAGDRAGVWCDFASGERGDALDLIAAVLFAGDKRQAVPWALKWLNVEDRPGGSSRQGAVDRAAGSASVPPPDATSEDVARRAAALRIWGESAAKLTGTAVESYLAARGILFPGAPPLALRHHPALYCAETKTHLPAMVAAIRDRNGNFLAVHRTYLRRDTGGRYVKAKLNDAKKTLGRYAGGYIELAAPLGAHTMLIAEGIENALSVAPFMREARITAAVSLANLARVVPPEGIRVVIVCADNDAGNAPARLALAKAIHRFLERGLRVKVMRPPAGVKDANDLLRASTNEKASA